MVETPANLLTVDSGNSTVDCLCHATGKRLVLAASDLGKDVRPLASFVEDVRPSRCIAQTVVPGGLDALATVLRDRAVRLLVAGRDLPCPLPIAYRTPATLGTDRWLGALAAHRCHGRAVVVDCGSATTVNLVSADGTFRGGPIGPGLQAFVIGLAAATPRLPVPRLDVDPVVVPSTSQDAVDAGVLLGWCGMVERLVAGVLRAADGPAQVVATGGQAARLVRLSRLRVLHVPDLVHQGLRLLDCASAGPSR